MAPAIPDQSSHSPIIQSGARSAPRSGRVVQHCRVAKAGKRASNNSSSHRPLAIHHGRRLVKQRRTTRLLKRGSSEHKPKIIELTMHAAALVLVAVSGYFESAWAQGATETDEQKRTYSESEFDSDDGNDGKTSHGW